MPNEKTCYITAQRDIPKDKLTQVRAAMRREILAALRDGHTYFISGLGKGGDLLFAEQAALLQDEGYILTLEALLPYRTRLNCREPLFHWLVARCQAVGYLGETYSRSCYVAAVRAMVQRSSRVVAACSDTGPDRAFFAAVYAQVLEKELRAIRV